MGSLPRPSVVTGPRRSVTVAPLTRHMAHLRQSEETALVYSDENGTSQVTYASLFARTNALARAITARARATGSNQDGDYVIAVCMQPTHNTVTALLAIWKAGAAYVPMEPSGPQARVKHILADAVPALVIYDDSAGPAMFTGSGIPTVSFEELLQEASSLSTEDPQDTEVLAASNASSIAIVLYTSGSTGVPKGVRIPYSAICNRLWWQFRTFPYSDTEVTCVWKTALTFLDSVTEIWGPLLHGRTLLVLSRETTRDPQKLVRVLSENQVQFLVLVPTLLRSILLSLSLTPSETPLKNLKLWVCSGETLSKELAGQFFKTFGDQNGYKLANFYGSTEVMGDVTYHVLEKVQQLDLFTTVPIGTPIDNCVVYLLDDEMNPVSEAIQGQVWVAGANLAAGYVRGHEVASFQDNPHSKHPDFGRLYRTGDFGVLNKGVILYCGRTDSQVKIRGHRVDLQEVDRAVASVLGVDKCVVLCYGSDQGNPEILAFVTLDPSAKMTARHVETSLKTRLTSYMIPQVIEIESVPLLEHGKVDRQALLKMYEHTNNDGNCILVETTCNPRAGEFLAQRISIAIQRGNAASVLGTLPTGDSEVPLQIDYTGVEPTSLDKARVLFETVGAVLGRAARGALSVRAGFFELGGNSLNSIFTITQLRDKGYYIGISAFLGAANLGEVLACLSTNPDSDRDAIELFKSELMRDDHKENVIRMIAGSFCVRTDLCCVEQFPKKNYAGLVCGLWSALINAGLSVVLTDEASHPVAVALNFDARDEPELVMAGGLSKTMSFLETVESSVRDSMLPSGKGTVLHSLMMATSETMSARDNVSAIIALEIATMRLAKERGFKGVFATNTNPLTQQLGRDVFGFQTLLDYQLNQYVDPNGVRIFGEASDEMRAVVCWKPVE